MSELSQIKLVLTLADKIPFKELKGFHDDAGWAPPKLPKESRGQVQWAVVTVGGRKIAIARLELARPEFCFVTNFAVLRQFRGQGVGGWLLQRIEQHCVAQGVRRLILEPAAGTLEYYRKRYFSDDPLVPGCLKKELTPLLRRRFQP